MSEKRILFVDDAEELAPLMGQDFADQGFPANIATTPSSLLGELSSNQYEAIILDVELGNIETIQDTYSIFVDLFPGVNFPHGKVLDSLCCSPDDPASGKYLLPMIKAIDPEVKVIILTGGDVETNHHYFNEWGATGIVQKLAEDDDGDELPSPPGVGVPGEPLTKNKDERVSIVKECLQYIGDTPSRPIEAYPPENFALEEILSTLPRGFNLEQFLKVHTKEWPKSYGLRGEILYFNKNQKLLEQIAQDGFSHTRSSMRILQIDEETVKFRKSDKEKAYRGKGICAYCALEEESVTASQVAFEKRFKTVGNHDSTVCELAIPLVLGGELVGVLNLEADREHAFNNRHREYFEQIAAYFALIIEHETFRREEQFLNKALREISESTNRDKILMITLNEIRNDLVGIESSGCILVPDDDPANPRRFQVVVNHNLNLKTGEIISIESLGVIRQALENDDSQCYWSKKDDDCEYVALAEGINSEYALVMKARGLVVAILDLESPRVSISERYQRAIKRLTSHAAMMISGLQERGIEERQDGIEDIQSALTRELHTIRGTYEYLIDTNITAFSPNSVELAKAIKLRLENARRIIEGFLGPTTKTRLSGVFDPIKIYARKLQVDLDIICDPNLEAWGTETGLRWLFENLILNTVKHKNTETPKAWLRASATNGYCNIIYWDNGTAPDDFENILNERHAGQGIKDIIVICKRYNWNVSTSRHDDGGLQYTFSYRL